MKITAKNTILHDQTADTFDVSAPGVVLVRCKSVNARGNGFLVRSGASAVLIDCVATGAKGRGVQADKGHAGLTIMGGEFHHCVNDGIGLDGGACSINGASIHDNGLPGVDSRDGIQLSGRPKSVSIVGCTIQGLHNAAIIGEFAGGIIAGNVLKNCRHGLAVAGNRERWLYVMGNSFLDNENGIFFYEESPTARVVCNLNNRYAGNKNLWHFDKVKKDQVTL